MSNSVIKERVELVEGVVEEVANMVGPDNQNPINLVMTKLLRPETNLQNQKIGLNKKELEFIERIYVKISQCFFTENEFFDVPDPPLDLLERCEYKRQENLNLEVLLVNYLIFIAAMHNKLAGYEVRHSYVHTESIIKEPSAVILASSLPSELKDDEEIFRSSITPEQLPEKLLAASDIMMHMLMSPINRIYEEKYHLDKISMIRQLNLLLRDFQHITVGSVLSSAKEAFQYSDIELGEDILSYLEDRASYISELAEIEDYKNNKEVRPKNVKKSIDYIKYKYILVGPLVPFIKLNNRNVEWDDIKKFWIKSFSVQCDNDFSINDSGWALETIIENLISNAIKYGINSPIKKDLSVADKLFNVFKFHFILSFGKDKSNILEFWDTGWGIDSDSVDSVIEDIKTYQIEGPSNKSGKDLTGLGSWLIKHCINDIDESPVLEISKIENSIFNKRFNLKYKFRFL
jgi:signal transduction histidine kinase